MISIGKIMPRLSIRPSTIKRKSSQYAARSEIGNIKDVFKGLENFMDILSDMEGKGEAKTERTGEIDIPDGKAMYGISVKIGGEGVAKLEHFGNIIRDTDKGPVVEKEREPVIDIHEEEDRIEVIAELPGVMEKNITCEIKDGVLILNAIGEERKYNKEVVLPSKASVLRTSYKNGIYRLILKKERTGK